MFCKNGLCHGNRKYIMSSRSVDIIKRGYMNEAASENFNLVFSRKSFRWKAMFDYCYLCFDKYIMLFFFFNL